MGSCSSKQPEGGAPPASQKQQKKQEAAPGEQKRYKLGQRRKEMNPWALYDIEKKIGTGGYGKVLLVKDKESKKPLAMKTIDRVRGGKSYDERFWVEAETLAKLDHESILEFEDAFLDNSTFYLVTELLSGGELLDHILKSQRFTERNASEYLRTILVALKFLHDNGMMHLDLKPENFVFSRPIGDEGRRLKLIDFGCVQCLRDDEQSTTRTGTPYYIAPEMLQRKVTKTGKTLKACDMWSMGVILYILVTGRLPFYGNSRKEILQSVLKGTYEYPEEVELSDSVKDLISKLLELDTDARLTVDQALQHPWLKDISSVPDVPLHPAVLAGISSCFKDTNLKRALANLLVAELTPDDKKDIQRMFEEGDKNKDGVLTVEELVAMVERYGYDTMEAVKVAKKLVDEFDLDKDGVINLEEFSAIGVRGMLSLDNDFVNKLFDYIDLDGNGEVSRDEIEMYFAERPDFNLEIDVLALIEEADLDKNGLISRDEFISAMNTRKNTTA